RELAVLHETGATMQRVQDRNAAMKIQEKHGNGDSVRMSHNQNGDSHMGGIPTLLQINQVCEKIGVKKSTVYKWMDEQKFPRPLKLSPTCVRWREDDIANWLQGIEVPSGNGEQPLARQETPRCTVVTPMPVHTVDAQTLQSQVRLAVQKAGGATALARALGIKHTAPYGWKRIPAERVLDVEALTAIPCSELRPDIYPPDRFAQLPLEAD
ncbi:YdaS family helix-turn-helix protein, partial [Stenotrophomonas maltophilia group sp. RNC7]|uniref:YdaS family helix-turn-helix protein n=1 Tax=Stenotrophomonas maltophilia group sp. RNC7 TaxID=3071467 RepID=UPI0027DF946C